jgi:hypothetical protein
MQRAQSVQKQAHMLARYYSLARPTRETHALVLCERLSYGSISPADLVTAPQAQHIFDTVAERAGHQNKSAVLSCLRALPLEQF